MADMAAEEAAELLAPLKFALPGALLLFSLLLFGFASLRYVLEVNGFAELLLNLPKPIKRECTKPIRCDAGRDDIAVLSNNSVLAVPGYSLPALFNSAILIVLAGGAGVLLAQMLNIEDYNKMYRYLNDWVVSARVRKANAIESALGALFAILEYNTMTTNDAGEEWNYVDVPEYRALAENAVNALVDINKQLFEKTADGAPSTVGYDAAIDALHLESRCTSDADTRTRHESYRCSSAVQLMQWHVNTIREVILDPGMYKGDVRPTSAIGQLVHLLDRHMLPLLLHIDDLFGTLGNTFKDDFLASHRVFFGVELALIAVAAILVVAYCWTVNSCYDVLLVLLKRVSPVHILACEPLEAYLLNKSTGKRRAGLTADERIIDSSADCIVCMSPSGVIDMINPAVTHAFGYTPEQLLGQCLVSLLAADQADRVAAQMKLMADRQAAATFEGHSACVTDDDAEVPCSLVLMAIFDGDEVGSFVAIFKDESAVLRQQRDAELAKKQSETLLYQILPRDIVARLNACEKDISFSIPSATIIFIDIVKFSEYAADLTPQEIMGNLSLIFCGFDEALVQYPMLIKIKLIGDVYMAAGGLFNPDSPPHTHAEQVLRFAIDALSVIDEVNVRLTAALAVRIGVNTGGPVLAGVLGTDKPAFDIIGDPINIAARLQSTDQPSRIQISEDTQALVANMEFSIELRGETELKGKGAVRTYFVEGLKEPGPPVGASPSALEDLAKFMPNPSAGP
jgi:PAS domain S-box-containing protein